MTSFESGNLDHSMEFPFCSQDSNDYSSINTFRERGVG